LVGKPVIVGASLSVTVIVKLSLELFPVASVAVNSTVVVPTGKKSPTAAVASRVATEQLSRATGEIQLARAPHSPGALVMMTLDGMLARVGASSSSTVMLKLALTEFPARSEVENCTAVVPTGKESPGDAVAEKVEITQLSPTIGVPQVATAVQSPGCAVRVMFPGTFVIVGS